MTDLHQRLIDGLANTPVLYTPPGSGASQSLWDDEIERVARALLPVIAAHEAEVVGSVLDRIDALHEKSTTRVYTERECQDGICDDHHDPISGAIYCPSYLLDVCRECSHYCCDDGDRDEPFPCPTRRLTAEIRGEMSHG